ncbi:ComF family protein [Caldimonas tepidiphila]|uniref:ComF family protein n=1 Tax=Caldimonas tepidiphila TaxID=2315841 RepID=UPI000E5A2468|nr:phosphoribosyltransferase family protein [Caldimonas tepidiphila]
MFRRPHAATALNAVRPVLRRIGDALPGQCAVCRAWQRGRICTACAAAFGAPRPRCRRCAVGVPAGVALCGACLREPPAFDAAFAAFDYAYPWDGLVAALKFRDALDLAAPLAQQLAAALPPDAPPAVLVVPVPLSQRRLAGRGYNQAWELARRVAGWRGVQGQARLLLRLRDTAHQLELRPDERAANVRGAFAVEPGLQPRLAGRHVALVDDVMTTGATVAEIARVLRRGGAASVQVWVVARTPPG